MPIPGIPGASKPTFRTRDRQWIGLDTMVRETCGELSEEGFDLSPYVVKVTIQTGRIVVSGPEDANVDWLVEGVQEQLRERRVLISDAQVQAILTTYAGIIATMEIEEINEFVS